MQDMQSTQNKEEKVRDNKNTKENKLAKYIIDIQKHNMTSVY